MTSWIESNIAWTFLLIFALLSTIGVHFWLRKRYKTGLQPRICVLLVFVFSLAWFLADDAGQREAQNLKKMLQGFAPTYAYEMQMLGHPTLSLETSPDDPLYLSLIAREIEWLRINPAINDVYTFRKTKDGKVVLMVDSETDYDRNGLYEGDREQRTLIGEEYPEADENLMKAFEGFASFDAEPYTDRWGTWVSAYSPIFREDGSVDAVLGVDYGASGWVSAIARRKTSVIVPFFLLSLVILVSSAIITFMRAEMAERRKLEACLLQSQKMDTVGTLAGGIAHDLNNQLTPLVGYLDMLLSQLDPKNSTKPMLDEAMKAARRCADVVQRLVSFSKPSTGKKEILSVKEMLNELGFLFQKIAPATIQVRIDCPDDLWNIEGNSSELHTALMNLAVNARDAMPSGGELSIRVRNIEADRENALQTPRAIPTVLIEVSDTGQGIDPKILPRIFEPFFTTKDKSKGTGLGLSMVFNIVKEHNGRIDVESQVGKGASFYLYLPATTKEIGQNTSRDKNSQQSFLPKGSESILFVDDEESLRVMGKAFLSRLGYQAIVAKDGQEAVEIYSAKKDNIDLVVMDMTMPRLTGKETMRRILEIEPNAKIILCSGYTVEGGPEELVKAGAKHFIQKPYTIQALAAGMRQVLDK